jgi:hypothetical protein
MLLFHHFFLHMHRVAYLTLYVVMAAVMHVMMAAAAATHHHVLLVGTAVGLTAGVVVHHSGIHLMSCYVFVGFVLCCVVLCLEKKC